MPYGAIKVDNITFTNAGADQATTVSGIYRAITSGVTVTGTISGATIQGATVSGTTVTGTTANFVSGVFTTQISGATVTGTTANFTSGNFTALSGASTTVTSGIFAVGSAAAPSISFASDPNTGIYSPGADQVAISTGGSGRLFVDASGNVGIGTASPGYALDISSADTTAGLGYAARIRANATAGAGSLQFTNSAVTTQHGVISFGTNGVGLIQADGASSRLAFATNATERLRIDSSGRLLIGTSSATAQALCVIQGFTGTTAGQGILSLQRGEDVPANGAVLGVINFTNSNSNAGAQITAARDGGTWTSGASHPSRITFSIAADGSTTLTERMRITSAGLVGIGTSSPGSSLHVNTASGDCKQTISASAGTTSAFTAFVNTTVTTVGTENSAGGNLVAGSSAYATILSNNGAYPIQFGTNNTVRATLDSSGRLGIGTTSPGSAFHVIGNIQVGSTSDTIYSSNFANYSSSSDLSLISGSASLLFKTGAANTERARIDTSGRLLVGTSTARTNVYGISPYLQAEGANGNSNRSISVVYGENGVGDPLITLCKHRGSTVGGNTIVSNGDGIGQIVFTGADGTNFIQAAAIRGEVDGTPGANDMPGRLVFSTTADGAASPTERMRIGSDGTAYSCANTTGVYVGSVTGAGTTIGLIVGRYSASNTQNGTNSFVVWTNGNVINTNNSYGAFSDVKLKENIVDANSQWDDLKALQVRNYNFKEGQTHTQIGLVAQEAELVSPGLVSESPDRDPEGNDLGTVTKSVNYSVLYMKAVKALQEAMERIEALEAKVTALEGA